ncbi:MAG TPA: murein L,D-transpeptidase catalytic domain family protein, partial [Chitinophagaceae bacterium]
TKGTYTGKHGKSLRLSGKEKGFNANAEARAIVVHGADYVNAGRVNSGFMGRSQGCPALPMKDYAKVINLIKDGSVMFIYHPSQNYIQQSQLING